MTTKSSALAAERLPIVEEEAWLEKHPVETGRVRVRTLVEEQPVEFHETLAREAAEVERVPVGKPVDSAPDVRREGDTLIIPVLEERLVLRKELVLVEEIRVRMNRKEEPVVARATRRVMRAEVQREPAGAAASEGGPAGSVSADDTDANPNPREDLP